MGKEQELTGYPSIDKPWLKYYTEDAISIALPERTIYEHIYQKNQDNLDRICLSYYGTNITYRQFFDRIDNIANAFESYCVKENDIVTLSMINSPECICALFALSKIGAVANTVTPMSSSEELAQIIKETNSHVVITLDIFQDKYLSIMEDAQIDTVIVSTVTQSMSFFNRLGASLSGQSKRKELPHDKRFISWNTFINASNNKSVTVHNPNAPVIINYTGGTTGGSKGVLLSSNAILAVAEQYIIGSGKELSRNSTWAQVLPLFIAFGVTCSLMVPLCVGMTLIVRIPMGESITQLCKKFKPNHIVLGPAYWEAFAKEDLDMDLSYLVAPITGGDVLRNSTEAQINNYLKKCNSQYNIMNGYGMTEVGAAVSVNFRDKYEFGSVGLPFVHNIVSAFDIETGKELKFGEEGEICIQTPSTMIGYINNEVETKNIIRIHENGQSWVHTGDIGFISEKGFIHISGRIKRFMHIKANTVHKKLYSIDIEKLLLMSKNIVNCAVVPIDDETYIQVPVAFVIPKNNGISNDILKDELSKLCNDGLGELYSPRKYYFVDSFPLTKIGKVDYNALEKQAAEIK